MLKVLFNILMYYLFIYYPFLVLVHNPVSLLLGPLFVFSGLVLKLLVGSGFL